AKAADVEPAAIVTEAGTESAALELERATEEPPVRAAWLSVTVHVLDALGPRVMGAQVSAVGVVEATKLIVALRETPLRVAVMVELWLVLKVAEAAVKVNELDPAATINEAGTVSRGLVLESVTKA